MIVLSPHGHNLIGPYQILVTVTNAGILKSPDLPALRAKVSWNSEGFTFQVWVTSHGMTHNPCFHEVLINGREITI